MIQSLCVFGTRPEAIKMAPLVKQLAQHPGFDNKVCVTGQHRQMLEPFLTLFSIIPDFNLDVMTPDQNLSMLTVNILKGLTSILEHYRPDIILVHGDTTTTFVATLVAYYYQIPVAHVEAGLRTENIFLPWPEEANRKLTSVLAKFHFAPTTLSRHNLLREGISSASICVTGNTVIDALFYALRKIESDIVLKQALVEQFSYLSTSRRVILVTGHRRESFGDGFRQICKALKCMAERFPEVDIVYPVHLNPKVQEPVYALLSDQPNIYLIDPIDYLPFVYLMRLSYLILTDSGGIQEEAPSLGKPVLVMRSRTERPEAINAGTVKLVGTDIEIIMHEVACLLNEPEYYQKMAQAQNPYGDGEASSRIVRFLAKSFEDKIKKSRVKEKEVLI